MKLPVRETTLPELVEGYRAFARLDVSHFDRVITSKYPAWIVAHPYHVVWMFHPLRGLYDTYHTFGMPERAEPDRRRGRRPRAVPRRARRCGASSTAASSCGTGRCGPPAPTTPSWPCRRRSPAGVVHWLDAVALSPPAVRRHLRPVARPSPPGPATSRRAPTRSSPTPRPTCPTRTGPGSSYLFTASRLDGPKRLDLLIDAMAHVPQEHPAAHRRHRTPGRGAAAAGRHRPAGEVPRLRARPRPRRPLRQRARRARSSRPTRTTGSSRSRPWPAAPRW